MIRKQQITLGLIVTILIFTLAAVAGKTLGANIGNIPASFPTHSTMLLLSIIAIFSFRKSIHYNFTIPAFKDILKAGAVGFLTTIVVNISLAIFTKILGGSLEPHPLLAKMNPMQVFIFVFIYASVAEEFLFRGFLQNCLSPLKHKGINFINRQISLPVIISALLFGLSHLIVVTSGVGTFFMARIVVFSTILGLIAGYFHEKHNNHALPIVVHMSGNLMGVFGAFMMH